MGWDTQIIVLVEEVSYEQCDVAKFIYNHDISKFSFSGIPLLVEKEVNGASKLVFISYERRKYLPHWTIEEISKKYPSLYFTVLGSSPDFLCGPAGIVKIINGEIIDSYGFGGKRQEVLENPNPNLIYEWFGRGKIEEGLRNLRIRVQPKKWVNELYHQYIIEFDKEEECALDRLVNQYPNGHVNNEWVNISIT